MAKIVNTKQEDFHMHSLNYSDGLNTIDEMVVLAGKIGLKKIAITDHSQATLDAENFGKKNVRGTIIRWKNIHNNVEVIFGVEADLLDEDGNICDNIQGKKADFMILSAHDDNYRGDFSKITLAYLNAIKKHHKAISCIGHINAKYFEKFVDVEEVIKIANKFGIPVEFNCSYLLRNNVNIKNTEIILAKADKIMVNSDAHTLYELKFAREVGFKFLEEHGLKIK